MEKEEWNRNHGPDSEENAYVPPFDPLRNNFLLFDNAHETYWDGPLWKNFFKDTIQGGQGVFVALFCSYGSPTTWSADYDHGTSLILDSRARISLTAHYDDASDSGYLPIGLLFSREEFDETVDRFRDCDRSFIFVDKELRETLFEWTMGHAGAIGDLLDKLCIVVSPTII